jgi:hypothetical protein
MNVRCLKKPENLLPVLCGREKIDWGYNEWFHVHP